MAFDPTKPVQTRNGRPVTILATGVQQRIPGTGYRLPGQTVLARIDDEVLRYFHPCGAYSYKSEVSQRDLVNVPEKAEPSGQDGGERVAIVRWLRAPTKGQLDWHRKMLADEIEAGDHLKGNSDG